MKLIMSTNPQDTPSNPLEETAEKDQAGNTIHDILKEQVGDELQEDPV